MARTLRLDPTLARLVAIAAASKGQSSHAWIIAAIRGALLRQGLEDGVVRAELDRVSR